MKRIGRILIALVTMICLWAFVLPTTGCNGVTVAQDIVNWTPALQAGVATVDSTLSLLAPPDAPIFAAATVGFDAASNVLVGQCKAYLANPTAGVLATLQSQALAFQQNVTAAVLAAAKITDTVSQQHALAAINGVATIIAAIVGLISSIKGASITPASVTAPAAAALLRPFRRQSVQIVATHYDESVDVADAQLQAAGF